MGEDIACVGDVDGDGVADVAIGLPGLDKVRIRSGVDGGPLVFLGGPAGTEFGDEVMAVGDVDLDGVPDVGVCAPELLGFGQFSVRSSASGAILFTALGTDYQVRLTATGLGDIDLDGVADFAYSDSYAGYGDGRIQVISGATSTPLAQIEQVGGSSLTKPVLAAGRDLNGDGIPDLVTESQYFDQVLVFDGSSLANGLTHQVESWHAGSLGPEGVALVDDVNGDAVADVIVSSGGRLQFLSANAPAGDLQVVGPTIESAGHLSDTHFDDELAGVGDVDGDGVGDVIAHHDHGVVGYSLLSGADGRTLYSQADALLGRRVTGAGDLDGDGVPDVIVSTAPGAGSPTPGQVRALSSLYGQIETFGYGQHPSIHHAAPEMVVNGGAIPGGELTVTGWSDDAEQGWLLFGPQAGAVVLPNGSFVYVAPLVFMQPVSLPDEFFYGHLGQWTIPVPEDAAGLQFALQLVIPTTDGLSTTQATAVEVMP